MDGDGGGREGDIATGIAELSNGEEWLHGKVGYDMAMAGSKWKPRDIQVSFMS